MSKFDWRHADLEGDGKPKGRDVKKEIKLPKLTNKKNKGKNKE
jgi:hypothetical protein